MPVLCLAHHQWCLQHLWIPLHRFWEYRSSHKPLLHSTFGAIFVSPSLIVSRWQTRQRVRWLAICPSSAVGVEQRRTATPNATSHTHATVILPHAPSAHYEQNADRLSTSSTTARSATTSARWLPRCRYRTAWLRSTKRQLQRCAISIRF